MGQGTSHFTIKEGTQVNIQGLVGLLSYSVGASLMPPLILYDSGMIKKVRLIKDQI